MKKALVMTFVLVLGLGFAAFADGTLSGVWDTDISLYPAASVFGDFIKSFTSEVDVDFTIGGWVFGMESTFGLLGLTGMDFEADGTLGAFAFDLDIDFDPMVLTSIKTEYENLQTASACTTLTGIKWNSKTVTKAYTAAFDDMTADVSVSIAGVNLGTVLVLEGMGNEYPETVHTLYMTQTPNYNTFTSSDVTQSGSYTATDPTAYGAGWKLSASGSFGGATLTARAYFNLSETSTYAENSGYALVYLADYFTKSGTYSIVCPDCVIRFSGAELLLEDVSFACTTFKALVVFDCCGFSSAKFLLEDVGFGCCWDVGIDLLIGFDVDSKSISLEPDITLANACFTIDAVIAADVTKDDFELQGIDIRKISLEYSWNGITFKSATSFDIANKPLLGSFGAGTISSPTKIWVWEADTKMTTALFTYTAATVTTAATCVLNGNATFAVDSSGAGYYKLKSFACEKASAWEMFSIKVDGDSCCGGDFDITAAFYLGDVTSLADLDGSYFYDTTAASGTVSGTYAELILYGSGYSANSAESGYKAAAEKTWSGAACDTCTGTTCSKEIDENKWDADYTGKTDNRLFDWIETDVDVVFAITSAFDLTAGFDITCWGWEDFTFGFVFTF